MALGDFPYPIVDLRLTHIAAGLNEVKKLKSCCLSANTIAEGLDPVYCPGATPAERLANLKADRQHTYWKNYNPPSCICPDEYSPVNGECQKISIEDVEPPSSSLPFYMVRNPVYTKHGVKIYDSNFNLDGTGNYTLYQFDSDNTFWHNFNNAVFQGVMNRTAIWVEPHSDNQVVGFSKCIDIAEEKTYLVGIGVDNFIDITLDGKSIVAMPDDTDDTFTFDYWHVYPVTIKPGFHIIQVVATNQSSVAAVGIEIYDCTPEQLMETETQVELDPYVIFSTQDLRPVGTDPVVYSYSYLGTNGYEVREGWSLVMCAETPYYRKIEYLPCE